MSRPQRQGAQKRWGTGGEMIVEDATPVAPEAPQEAPEEPEVPEDAATDLTVETDQAEPPVVATVAVAEVRGVVPVRRELHEPCAEQRGCR